MKYEGTCYPDSVKYLLTHQKPGMRLAHGQPTLRIAPYIQYGHAWVEDGDTVIDALTGVHMPKMLYYALGNIDPKEVNLYTAEETLILMSSHQHYGPWEGALGIGPKGI